MDLKSLQGLPPDALHRLLPSFLSGFVAVGAEVTAARLERLVGAWSAE